MGLEAAFKGTLIMDHTPMNSPDQYGGLLMLGLPMRYLVVKYRHHRHWHVIGGEMEESWKWLAR